MDRLTKYNFFSLKSMVKYELYIYTFQVFFFLPIVQGIAVRILSLFDIGRIRS